MRISFIGAGRVAFHLAQKLNEQNVIVDIYSTTLSKSSELAQLVNANVVSSLDDLDKTVDLIVIAVSDQSIQKVIQELHSQVPNTFIVHTSGSTHLKVLSDVHSNSGVFYPLQTFSFESQIDWINTPIFVEANLAVNEENLENIASQFSQKVYRYSSEQRLSLHLAAVFACNFTNYCYDVAKQIVDADQVEFSLLHPLIEATAKKALKNDPRKVQTGPAVRGDQNIIDMHKKMLLDARKPEFENMYSILTKGIMNSAKK
jgi:predicted short-subunit dehydrogenase-like oxidoreductase (DUF2520 family)